MCSKKGGRLGELKRKEVSVECLKSKFILGARGNAGTKEKRGRELKVCEKERGENVGN